MPPIHDQSEAKRLIDRRHPEYSGYVEITRWILDTLEGGDAYREAQYGIDHYGKPVRNLLRHKREYPGLAGKLTDEFGEPLPFQVSYSEILDTNRSIDMDYEIRRQRTPVPSFLSSFIERQLSKIYKRSIKREGPDLLMQWIDNIDGRETSLEEWMREVVAPLLSALGMIDLAFGHPVRAPDEPAMFGDQLHLPERQCIVEYILPENILWWRLDYTGRYYVELNTLKYSIDNDGNEIRTIVNWTSEDWSEYNEDGKLVDDSEHNFGIVPIVRVFDRRRFREDHTARSRMYPIVDLSKCYYNEESELIVNNTLHNNPIIQGPDTGDADDRTPINRWYMLKKIFDAVSGTVVNYEYLQPNVTSFEFMNTRLKGLLERMESAAALTRSAGAVQTQGRGQVAQSGVSKAYDQVEGSEYLASIAKILQSCEWTILQFAWIVLNDGFANTKPADFDSITVLYPTDFNLLSFDQYALIVETMITYLQSGLGKLPTDEKMTLKFLVRSKHPDMSSKEIEEIDKEIEGMVDNAVKERKNSLNRPVPPPSPFGPPNQPPNQPPNPQMNQQMNRLMNNPAVKQGTGVDLSNQ
jgi:hypothetical protein